MAETTCEGENFKGINFTIDKTEHEAFEDCSFDACTFAKADLRQIRFTDCVFTECDLSMANLIETGIRSCVFNNCKMMGLQFQDCSTLLFSLKANDSNLSHSSFLGMNLKKLLCEACLLEEVDFTDANLEGANFEACRFPRAIFDNTNLKKLDLSSCFEFDINPSKNEVYKASFSKENVQGLLRKYDIRIKA